MSFLPVIFQNGFRLFRGEDLNTDFAALANQLGPQTGVTYYVNETIGVDQSNGGQNPLAPLKTIRAALDLEKTALAKYPTSLASVGRNSIIAIWGTIHLTSTLSWDVPGTHLLGVCAPLLRGKRARISLDASVSTTAGFNKLVEVTKTGCSFNNFGTFYGCSNTAAALICWSDIAGRSSYNNVEFLGFGDGTVSTGSSNLTGSRAFKAGTGFIGETTWRNCVFGADTEDRNATNYTVELAPSPLAAPRMSMIDCVFECRLGASGGSSSHILAGATSIDRYLDLVRCRFHNFSTTAMAQILNISSSAGGAVEMDQCTFGPGGTAWQGTPTTNVQMNMTAPGSGGGKAITNA